jgi:predicted Zn-dependent protease
MTNYFHKHFFMRFFIALFLLVNFQPIYGNEINLPNIGDPSGSTISPEQERQLGENLMRWLRQNNLVVEDPIIQDYIETLGYKLVSNSDHQDQKFTFFVIADPTLNAFAAPGGFIGVNSGLIQAAQSESELAAVLAHEVAHITQRHMARSFDAAKKQNLTTAAAILAAILLGQNSSDLAKAAITAGMAANTQMKINFTRSNEQEADRLGIQALVNAGYNPESMALFFERMEKAARLYGPQLPEFLSTHPVSVSRIADARNRARQFKNTRVAENLNYHLIINGCRPVSTG